MSKMEDEIVNVLKEIWDHRCTPNSGYEWLVEILISYGELS